MHVWALWISKQPATLNHCGHTVIILNNVYALRTDKGTLESTKQYRGRSGSLSTWWMTRGCLSLLGIYSSQVFSVSRFSFQNFMGVTYQNVLLVNYKYNFNTLMCIMIRKQERKNPLNFICLQRNTSINVVILKSLPTKKARKPKNK